MNGKSKSNSRLNSNSIFYPAVGCDPLRVFSRSAGVASSRGRQSDYAGMIPTIRNLPISRQPMTGLLNPGIGHLGHTRVPCVRFIIDFLRNFESYVASGKLSIMRQLRFCTDVACVWGANWLACEN